MNTQFHGAQKADTAREAFLRRHPIRKPPQILNIPPRSSAFRSSSSYAIGGPVERAGRWPCHSPISSASSMR